MRRTALTTTLISLGAAAIGLAACAIDPVDAVLSGRCEDGSTHCVDSQIIQFCAEELWQNPQECPPEISGTPPVEVEILTYCTEDGCRPGG